MWRSSSPTVAITSAGERAELSVASSSTVFMLSSPVRSERCAISDLPATSASAAATFSAASGDASTSAASFSKNGSTLASTSLSRRGTSCAAASITFSRLGGPERMNFTPARCSSARTTPPSRSPYRRIAIPDLPARPVRPERCTYESGSCGEEERGEAVRRRRW